MGNKIHLEFDVADFEPEDIEVKLEGGTLSVGGRRRAKFEKEAQVRTVNNIIKHAIDIIPRHEKGKV